MITYRNGAILTVIAAMMVTGTTLGSASAASGMSIMLEIDGNKIIASGNTASSAPISILVFAPNGNFEEADQTNPDSDFTYSVKLSGAGWQQDGEYTVKASQGADSVTAKIEVSNNELVRVFDFESTYEMDTMTDGDKTLVDKTLGDRTTSEEGLTLTDASQIGATTVMVTGTTDKSDLVTVRAIAPNGNFIGIDEIIPDADGTFAIEMKVGGPNWQQDGMYTIAAQQGTSDLHKDEIMVEIIDGAVVPEFGSAAIIVLVVAIVSIIAVTSRSRLGIQPRL